MTHRFSSLDGRIVQTNTANLPAPGMADSPERSVFTTVKVKNGRPVFFEDHAARLFASAHASGIDGKFNRELLREHCAALIAANASSDCALRIVLYAEAETVHEALQTRDVGHDLSKYAEGFRLITVRRNPPAGLAASHKTLDYRASLDALATARSSGWDEVLFVNSAGEAWECSVSNIFAVKSGIVRTPPATGGVLPGIIRARLLNGSSGFQVREEQLQAAVLLEADEVFVTNSLLGIMPVSAIDGQVFRPENRPVTSALTTVLARWEREDL